MFICFPDFEPTKDSSGDPLKVLSTMLHIDRPSDDEHDVLASARSKLSNSVVNSSSQGTAYTFRPLPSGEHDNSFEEELEFRYDRAFRAVDNSRARRQSGYGYRSSFRY